MVSGFDARRWYVLTYVSHVERQLLHHWLAHYRALGASALLVTVHSPTPLPPPTQRAYAGLGCAVDFRTGLFQWPTKLRHINARLRGLPPNAWFSYADADEFFALPRQVLPSAHYCGYMLDRLARRRAPTDVAAAPALGAQFPLACRLRRKLGRFTLTKVVLAPTTCPDGTPTRMVDPHHISCGGTCARAPDLAHYTGTTNFLRLATDKYSGHAAMSREEALRHGCGQRLRNGTCADYLLIMRRLRSRMRTVRCRDTTNDTAAGRAASARSAAWKKK